MSNFNNYKKFENVGIRSSNDTLIVMDSSNNNISLHSSDGGDDNVDTLSIKNIINKSQNRFKFIKFNWNYNKSSNYNK
tara:strand:- start:128 stop:361 length:234 start_codon:yes stop_codon:yes gene_type:complete